MTTSPLLTGGAGFDFEDGVAAIYLTALLLEGGVLGLGQFTATQVALQRAASGAPLDDVIVTGADMAGDSATLHLQVKSTLHIGDGPSNTDFREVVTRAWETVMGVAFRPGRDRVGAAVGSIGQTRLKALRRLQQVALESATAEDFWARFAAVTNRETIGVRDAFAAVLREVDQARADNDRLWRFFQHFIVLQFDIKDEPAKDVYDAVERLRSALRPTASDRAADLWRKLVSIAKDIGDTGGSIGRTGLLDRLTAEFQLEPARSSKSDLQRLDALGGAALGDIKLDISGYKVRRTSLIDRISEALTATRFVQITGQPGTGKSAVLRTIAEAERSSGFIFVLSEKRIEGNGWSGFAAANGLTSPSAGGLLSDVGASGTPTLFIDGIDRIVAKPAQQVVADILRAIATEPACAKWRVVASVRDENIEHVRTWIPSEFLRQTGIISIVVDSFDDQEAWQIAQDQPALAPLLNATGAVREIARRPFFLRVLAEGVTRANGGNADAPRSEIELIEAWWARGGYDAVRATARQRQQALLKAAEIGIPSFGRQMSLDGFDADIVQDLVDDHIMRDTEPGVSLGFAHDVFFEWALFQVVRSKGTQWLDLAQTAGEPPFFGRIVALLSQRAFERDEAWDAGLTSLENASARSQWRRAWLIAPFSSPLFVTYQSRIDGAFAQSPERLRRLLLGFQAERTQPNPLVLGGFAGNNLDRLARLRLADQLSWPSDYLAWGRLLGWFLPRCETLPPALVADTLPVFEAWIAALGQTPGIVPRAMKEAIGNWLKAIEIHRHPEHWQEILRRDGQSGWDAISDDELRQVEQSLRFQFFLATAADPDLQRGYFEHLLQMDTRMRESCSVVSSHASLIHPEAVAAAVDLCLAATLQDLPENEERRSRHFGGGSSPFEWDRLSLDEGGAQYFPPAPAREPFKTFFQKAPDEALRLVRGLCNHAMEAWRQLNRRDRQFGMTPRPMLINFPWGDQTFWGNTRVYGFYRGIFGPHILDSALMALEEWAFSELNRGRSGDEVIHAVVGENECCAVLGIALGVALQANAATPVSLALLASAHLWRWDVERGKADLVRPTQNEYGFEVSSKSRQLHEALAKANRLPVRQQDIRTLAMIFSVGQDAQLREAAKAAILRFSEALPFECEEEAQSKEAAAYLSKEAATWAAFADPSHYRLYRTDDPGKVAIGFEHPEDNHPETIARVSAAQESLSWFGLAQWSEMLLSGASPPQNISLNDAVAKVRGEDADALLSSGQDDPLTTAKQAAVVGVAALTVKQSDSVSPEDIEWAKTLLQKGAEVPRRLDEMTSPGSILLFHPAKAAARGLSFLILKGIDERWAKETLLGLMLHPLEAIYECTVDSCFSCWLKEPRFGWIALCLGLGLANERFARDDWQNREAAAARRDSDRNARLAQAMAALDGDAATWPEAPGPAAASDTEADDEDEEAIVGRRGQRGAEPREEFRYDLAGRVIGHMPLDSMVNTPETAAPLLQLADRLLAWTIAAHPPRRAAGRRTERATPPFEWTHRFMGWLAYLCSVLAPEIALARYIKPILGVEDDDACFEMLDPFVDAFVCRQIHDADTLSTGILENLKAISDRVAAADWRWDATRVNGNLTREKHDILKALFFVNVERADGASRFANRDWNDIPLAIPALATLIQRLASVTGGLGYFLELAERSIDHYPADALADTMSAFLVAQGGKPAALRSISAPERMAALAQTLAAREHPLPEQLRAKLLKLLDLLVELGDRRSAALLGSEWFKTVRRDPTPATVHRN